MEWKKLLMIPKLLILWSGRRDSNPRRPAWEIACGLKIHNIASLASMEGDRKRPVFNSLLQGVR
jgi:hypothetical protein